MQLARVGVAVAEEILGGATSFDHPRCEDRHRSILARRSHDLHAATDLGQQSGFVRGIDREPNRSVA